MLGTTGGDSSHKPSPLKLKWGPDEVQTFPYTPKIARQRRKSVSSPRQPLTPQSALIAFKDEILDLINGKVDPALLDKYKHFFENPGSRVAIHALYIDFKLFQGKQPPPSPDQLRDWIFKNFTKKDGSLDAKLCVTDENHKRSLPPSIQMAQNTRPKPKRGTHSAQTVHRRHVKPSKKPVRRITAEELHVSLNNIASEWRGKPELADDYLVPLQQYNIIVPSGRTSFSLTKDYEELLLADLQGPLNLDKRLDKRLKGFITLNKVLAVNSSLKRSVHFLEGIGIVEKVDFMSRGQLESRYLFKPEHAVYLRRIPELEIVFL